MRVYYPLISDLYNSPAEFTIASCLTVYHRAEQPRVELDLEITAGSYNAKVNLPLLMTKNNLHYIWL